MQTLHHLEDMHKARLQEEIRKATIAGEAQGCSEAAVEATKEKEKLLRMAESLESELKGRLKVHIPH